MRAWSFKLYVNFSICVLALFRCATFASELPKNFADLMRGVEANYRFSPFEYGDRELKEGQTYFLPLESLQSGQHEVAFLKVEEKIRLIFDRKKSYHHNEALFSKDESGQVILLKDCILLIDGNHKALASLWGGVKSMPVEILYDWRHQTFDEALEKLKENHLIWPYKQGEMILNPSPLDQMTNNPLRFWVSQALGKVKIKQNKNSEIKILKKKEIENPLAVKIGRDFPFYEFILALALESQGFVVEESEAMPTTENIEKARQLLKQTLMDESFPEITRLRQIFLVEDASIYQDEQRLLGLLGQFTFNRDCLQLLRIDPLPK